MSHFVDLFGSVNSALVKNRMMSNMNKQSCKKVVLVIPTWNIHAGMFLLSFNQKWFWREAKNVVFFAWNCLY